MLTNRVRTVNFGTVAVILFTDPTFTDFHFGFFSGMRARETAEVHVGRAGPPGGQPLPGGALRRRHAERRQVPYRAEVRTRPDHAVDADGRSVEENQLFKLTGQLPPCQNCHAALMRVAEQTGATINYEYGKPPQSVTYKGNGKGKPPTVSSTDKALEEKYKGATLKQPWSLPTEKRGDKMDAVDRKLMADQKAIRESDMTPEDRAAARESALGQNRDERTSSADYWGQTPPP